MNCKEFPLRRFHTVTSIESEFYIKQDDTVSDCEELPQKKLILFGGCSQDYTLIESMFEIDLTEIINSTNISRFEETKDMSFDSERTDSRDYSMEREDSTPAFFKIATQKEINGRSLAWKFDTPKRKFRRCRKLRNCRDNPFADGDLDNSPMQMSESSGNSAKIRVREIKFPQIRHTYRWGHSCSYFEGRLYVFGGRRNSDRNDLLSFDLNTERWEDVQSFNNETYFSNIHPRRRHSAAFLGNQLVIFGGFNDEFHDDMFYCQFVRESDASKEDVNYLSDTLK